MIFVPFNINCERLFRSMIFDENLTNTIIMRLTILLLFMSLASYSMGQGIRKIAAYDSESSYTSGVYCINDTGVFRYSWYYQEWYNIPGNGLTRVNDSTRIGAIAVYNNKISNSSGLFVFSDTAVFNYNWYAQTWFPLSNTGLPRNSNNKPDVYDLTVYGDSGSSSNSDVFALTGNGVYRYIWFYQEWYPLENTGLTVAVKNDLNKDISATVFPNPSETVSYIELNLQKDYNGPVEFAFFSTEGKLVTKTQTEMHGRELKYEIPKLFTGYFYVEIHAGNAVKTVRFIRSR